MAVERDREGIFRGKCINHPPNRFGGCEGFALQEGTSKCRTCGCVARSHVVYGPCTRHSCGGYDELPDVPEECCNCGCAPSVHRVITTSSLQTPGSHASSVTIPSSTSLPASANASVSEVADFSGEGNAIWDQIQHLAKNKRDQQLKENPPKRQGRKPKSGRGGARPNSGRKKSTPKELTVTPVELVSRRLGKYQPKGPKEFVSLSGVEGANASGLTLKTLEEAFLKHFLGFTRDQAKGVYQFCILKTLRGPRLSTDSHVHISGKQFYFYWKAGFEMDSDEDFEDAISETPEVPDDPELSQRPLSPLANNPPSGSEMAFRIPESRPSIALSQRAIDIRRRVKLKGLLQQVPNTLPVRPSAVLNLRKSIALPTTKLTEFPVAVTAFTISSDWKSIETEGPLHCVVDVEGFPMQPFSSGAFQNAFKASCVVPNKFLNATTKYILKQQKIEDTVHPEMNVDSLSADAMDSLDAECERKSAKVCQISAVANALCQHYNIQCRQIPDYGEEIRVLPSVFAKMGGQFPSCATLEQEIEGTWMKFLNNDGIVTGDQENQDEFRLKALAFAHWTFQKFDGKLLVCDLQGANYHLSDLEIASADERLFGIGNLSCTALEGFKSSHQCNIYCVALDLPGFDCPTAATNQRLTSDHGDGNQDSEVLNLSSAEEESLPSLMTLVSSKNMESQTSSNVALTASDHLNCGICLTNKIDVMFYKCGHMYCCESCAVKLDGTCPICRNKYDQIVKIYLG